MGKHNVHFVPAFHGLLQATVFPYIYTISWNHFQVKISVCSVQSSHSVMSNSLRPHELQHTRPPCPSPTPRVHSNSRPLSQWSHPAISPSVIPFSSCPQSLPPSKSFPMIQLFTWGGQSSGVSAWTKLHSCFKKWEDFTTRIKGRVDFWGHLAVCHLPRNQFLLFYPDLVLLLGIACDILGL